MMFLGEGGTLDKREENQAEAGGMLVGPEEEFLGLKPRMSESHL